MAKKIYIEITDGIPAEPIIQDSALSIPEGFEDSTDIITVGSNEFVSETLEYDAQRNWLKVLFLAKDPDQVNPSEAGAFPELTTAEQSIVCQFILMPHYYRIMFHGESGDFENWDILVKRTEGVPYDLLEGRALIYENMRLAVSEFVRCEAWVYGDYYANLTHAQNLFRDVFVMKELFIGSNDFEFRDFITSTGVHDETTGFKSKDYYISGLEALLIATYYANDY
jgi:hypothetical protein